MAVLKLFKTAGGVKEVSAHLAAVEADVQDLVEAHMEAMLGVTFLASEYVIDCVDGGRIDSLGLDENGAPVIVEYKRGTDAGVINQGLYYMAWLTNHKDAFRNLVRDRLGVTAASQILWSAPRLICVAGDFTRYDAHAVREHRRSIDLVRYRYFGSDHFGLETVASVTGHSAEAKRVRRRAAGLTPDRKQGGAMAELAQAIDEVLVGLGDGVTRVQRKQYRAYRRLRNFASVCVPQQTKILVYLKADPNEVEVIPGFTRDVTGLGHHGTGDLELQLRTERDLERAGDLLHLSYAAA
ncbi:endonuclease NucS domain-containing protein [Streptomyces spectabilis]|uniref:endonuclease NucS domain-containing protein n=1 Tax=Streptomyces spectabilis TaxID=68270 RepID=UPI001863A622|nr:endonuclease NucS domain-containing protein [Streptomyces spectabilis]